MTATSIGFLHPGAMGVSLAASARESGRNVFWASEGRSPETRARANEHGLADAATVGQLCKLCDALISVCPPHAAVSVAESVVTAGFQGIYADVNAISPDRTREVGSIIGRSGAHYVDGGIVGGPAWVKDRTTLYLSGNDAAQVARCFARGKLRVINLGAEIGRASALKMCYAARSKGTTALLAAIAAAAERLGIRDELEAEWTRDDPDDVAQLHTRMTRVTQKAWRFSGEMTEITDTLVSAGLPRGFHDAAHDIYARLSGFKNADPLPDLEHVLASLLSHDGPD